MHRGLALALILAGCTSGTTTLVLDLKTDLVPGIEFDELRLVIVGSTTEPRRAVTRSDDLREFARVFETTLDAGTHELRLDLLSAGSIVARRPVVVDLEPGARVVSLVIARSCTSAMCAADQACLGGRCVDPMCTVEIDDTCGPAECEADADCPTGDACAESRCEAGVCLLLDRGACAAGEYCHPADGCLSDGTADAGLPDAGLPDAGLPDAGPPDAGPPCAADRCVSHESGGLAEYDELVQVGDGTLSADAAGALAMTATGLRASAGLDGRQNGCIDVPPAARSIRVEMQVDVANVLAAPPGSGESLRVLTVTVPGSDLAFVAVNDLSGEVSWDFGSGGTGRSNAATDGAGSLIFTVQRASAAGVNDGTLELTPPGQTRRSHRATSANLFWDVAASPQVCVGGWSRNGYDGPEVRIDEVLVFVAPAP